MAGWRPLPPEVADWMGSATEPGLLRRPADAAEPVELTPSGGLAGRILRMFSVERRAS